MTVSKPVTRGLISSVPTRSISRNVLQLILLIGGMHAYCLWAYGATYWYDSIVYVQLADALTSDRGLEAFYTGPGRYLYQHVTPGVSLLWISLWNAFGSDLWIGLAILQRIVASLALVYLLYALRDFVPNRWLIVLAVMVSMYPFYTAFHNALLTESVSASMLLVGIGAILHTRFRDVYFLPHLIALTLAGAIAVQFRSYVGVVAVLCLAIAFFSVAGRGRKLLVLMSAGVVVLSTLAFPIYRWVVTNQFFLPNVDYISLVHALYVNVEPGPSVIDELMALPLPEGMTPQSIAQNGLNYPQAAAIGAHLKEVGLTDSEAKERISSIAGVARFENTAVVRNQLMLNLASLGLVLAPYCCDDDRVIRRGYTGRTYRNHSNYFFRWFVKLKYDYPKMFNEFVAMYSDTDATKYHSSTIDKYRDVVYPRIRDRPKFLKDPFVLHIFPSELWLVGFLGGLWFLWKQSRVVVLVLALPVPVIYGAALFASVVGSSRYGHPLFPIYFVGTVYLTWVIVNNWRRRSGRR